MEGFSEESEVRRSSKSIRNCIVKSLAQSTILSYAGNIEMDMKKCMSIGGGILRLMRYTVELILSLGLTLTLNLMLWNKCQYGNKIQFHCTWPSMNDYFFSVINLMPAWWRRCAGGTRSSPATLHFQEHPCKILIGQGGLKRGST